MPIQNGRSQAPWTDDEVASLNGFQVCGHFHPFTGNLADGTKVTLVATRDGWVAEEGGGVVQDWAHAYMADGSWRKFAEQSEGLERHLSRMTAETLDQFMEWLESGDIVE